DLKPEKNKTVLYLVNASERLRVDKIRFTKDSVFIEMPVFESGFAAKKISATRWEGLWTKGGAVRTQVMPFVAESASVLAPEAIANPVADITGKWAMTFTRGDQLSRPAIGEWSQKGHTLRGTILTPTGDYRYLSGVVNGDSLRLSTFDGAHAFLFKAKINNAQKITGGIFYSGAAGAEPWIAEKNDTATLPDVAAMYARDGEERLNFRFRDLDGKWVSINDAKFKNKVVIIQILGSWCPNCMDETAFLSEYYDRNKQRGVEIIGLAYEYSTDAERSRKSIRKFQDRFHVKYTLLNTGVTVTDSLRTEKTLPQLTPIKSFPSTIFLDRTGRVARIHTGFEGPGTGIHYEELRKEFAATVDKLLAEK
ncbi:MAG: TlpA family protein disulfide reductase, partial [Sediminibacterium sp.]|nr:TlpA family protein disulfide reductase [Sediminibacterium sp.]